MENKEITDALLLAYLDGEVDDATARLIEETPRYRKRTARLDRLQQRLAQNLAADAPSPVDITLHQLGLLPPDEAGTVAAYLQSHPHAARQLEALQAFWQQEQPAPPPAPAPLQTVKTWLATLLSRSGGSLQPALAGVRGEAEHVYQAGDAQIVLDIDEEADRPQSRVLAGLILSEAAATGPARLWSVADPEREWETAIDDDGNFVLTGLPPGRYTLMIRTESAEIYIESLAL